MIPKYHQIAYAEFDLRGENDKGSFGNWEPGFLSPLTLLDFGYWCVYYQAYISFCPFLAEGRTATGFPKKRLFRTCS
jgi:hypothetical protein